MSYTFIEIEHSVLDAMRTCGIPPVKEQIVIDGKKHRYCIVGDKKSDFNGEYRIYPDGERPAGYIKSYKTSHGVPCQTWCMARDESFLLISAEERERIVNEARARQKEREDADRRGKEKAVSIARMMYEHGTAYRLGDERCLRVCDYPRAKGLRTAPGARIFEREMILPLMNERGEVMSLQKITATPDGKYRKLFHAKAPTAGNFMIIESRLIDMGRVGAQSGGFERDIAFICEGWATGVTLSEATGKPVVVAYSAHNLLPVARKIRVMWPEIRLIGAPDDDRTTVGNPGMSRGVELIDELGMIIICPPFGANEKGTDWNDFAALCGLPATAKAVKDAILAALSMPGNLLREREKMFIHVSDKGKPLDTVENVRGLLAWYGIKTRYNVISKNVEYDIPGMNFTCDNERNAADGHITSKCVEHKLGKDAWKSYIWTISALNAYNPVKDWITGVGWDHENRLEALINTIRTPPWYSLALKHTLVTKWLISAVAAACSEENGFRCRGVLLLQGPQSIGKTTWLKNLIPKEHQPAWFGEGMTLSVDSKDSVKQAVSKWIVELGEVEATFKRSDINRLKGFITLAQDELRLPYAGSESRFPRRTVFAATVNDPTFLMDDTGNTRWWCIEAASLDYCHGIDMQQLFAQVYERLYIEGVPWYLSADEERLLETQNANYRSLTPAEEMIARRLRWDEDEALWKCKTVTDALIECGLDRPSQGDLQKAAKMIRQLTDQRPKKVGKDRSSCYFLPSAAKTPVENCADEVVG